MFFFLRLSFFCVRIFIYSIFRPNASILISLWCLTPFRWDKYKKPENIVNKGHFWPVAVCFLIEKNIMFILVSVFISRIYFEHFPFTFCECFFFVHPLSFYSVRIPETNWKSKYGSNLTRFLLVEREKQISIHIRIWAVLWMADHIE